jgi:hypothetical protein
VLRLRQTSTGDLDFTGGGPRLVRGGEAAQAGLSNRLGTQAGEWAYDLAYGVPWREAILRRYFKPSEVRAILAQTGSLVRGVQPIAARQVDIVTDPTSRSAQITIDDVRAGVDTLEQVSVSAAVS